MPAQMRPHLPTRIRIRFCQDPPLVLHREDPAYRARLHLDHSALIILVYQCFPSFFSFLVYAKLETEVVSLILAQRVVWSAHY